MNARHGDPFLRNLPWSRIPTSLIPLWTRQVMLLKMSFEEFFEKRTDAIAMGTQADVAH
jgi:hypothetical protein